MKSNILLLITTTFLFSINALHSQNIQWEKNYGGSAEDEAQSVRQTSDGGYILAGSSSSSNNDVGGNHGANDYWIVKLDDAGAIQWEKNFGGSEWDVASSIRETSDGGYVVAGTASSSDGDVGGNNGGGDYWIIKLDNTGTIQWENNFGGSEHDRARSIEQTLDGGYIVAGLTWSSDIDVSASHGSADYWVIKLDNTGSLQWEKNLGGSFRDEGNSIVQSSDGGFVVAGYSASSDGDVGANTGMNDYWIVKLDNSGAIQWEKNFGGGNDDNANAIQKTSDGGYIVVGDSWSTSGDASGNNGIYDYWVVKLDDSGVLEWEKNFGGSQFDKPTSVQQTSDNGYVIAGYSESSDVDLNDNNGMYDYWIIKLDNTGNLQWQNNYGGSDRERAYSVIQTSGGAFVLAGYSESSDVDVSGNYGASDYWIVKIDGSTSSLMNNKLQNPFSVYPNPTDGNLTIELGENEQPVYLEITDLNGRVVQEKGKITKDQVEIIIDKPAGIYFVNLFSEEESAVFRVVVK